MMLNKEHMLSAFPKDSTFFDSAVDRTLRQIHQEAALERKTVAGRSLKQVTSWALGFALLLIGVLGIAEGVRLGVFDFLLGQEDTLPQATQLVQSELAHMHVGHTDLRVTEAVYDGTAVRFLMSVTNDTIHRPLADNELDGDGEMGAALAADGVTALASFDWFTIDGVEYVMTGGSRGENVAGENDGEALVYFELLLSQDEGEPIPAPTTDFMLGVPVRIGDSLETQQLFIPVKLVAADLLRDLAPAAPAAFVVGDSRYTVTVTEAKLSPIRNAVELRVDVPDAVEEDAAQDCLNQWHTIALVDETGMELGNGTVIYDGLPLGETDDLRHFMIRMEFAPLESYPNRLFVAPMGYEGESGTWGANMDLAIELNMSEPF